MKCPCVNCPWRGCGLYHDYCYKYRVYNAIREKAATKRRLEADVVDATVKARLRTKGAKG